MNKLKILKTCLFVFCVVTANSQTIHVPIDYPTIQMALDTADVGDTIMVQPGTYFENILWPATQSLKLLSAGDSSNTIIDGNQTGRVLHFPAGSNLDSTTVLRGFKIFNGKLTGQNSSGAGIFFNSASPTLIELQITQNSCISLDTTNTIAIDSASGAGISANNSSPTIIDSEVSYNGVITKVAFGAGINLNNSGINIINCSIHNNYNQVPDTLVGKCSGSAIYSENTIVLNNCIYMDSTKVYSNNNLNPLTSGNTYGGAIVCRSGEIVINDSEISDNASTGYSVFGGAIALFSLSNAILENVYINGNSIQSNANALCYAGAVYLQEFSSIAIISSSIIENQLLNCKNCYGAAIALSNFSSINLTNTIVSNNFSSDSAESSKGGGIYLSSFCGADITKCIISNNKLGKWSTISQGAGIFNGPSCNSIIENCLIVSNDMGIGGTIYNGGAVFSDKFSSLHISNSTVSNNNYNKPFNVLGNGILGQSFSNIGIINSIISNPNSGQEIYFISSTSTDTITYSNIRGQWNGIGNIDINPQFISLTDFHLQPTSPCIAAGTLNGAPIDDLDGNPRPAPAGTNPDIGCYEINQMTIGTHEQENFSFTIYPNPANNYIVLHTHELNSSSATMQISDMLGKVVLEKTWDNKKVINEKIDLPELAKGTYIVSFSTEERVLNKKLVIK